VFLLEKDSRRLLSFVCTFACREIYFWFKCVYFLVDLFYNGYEKGICTLIAAYLVIDPLLAPGKSHTGKVFMPVGISQCAKTSLPY